MKKYFYGLCFVFTVGCTSQNNLISTNDTPCNSNSYCATVTFVNASNGQTEQQRLQVVVEDNYLTSILYPDGGAIGKGHFTAAPVKEGAASFFANNGDSYQVVLLNQGCDCNTSVTKDVTFSSNEIEEQKF